MLTGQLTTKYNLGISLHTQFAIISVLFYSPLLNLLTFIYSIILFYYLFFLFLLFFFFFLISFFIFWLVGWFVCVGFFCFFFLSLILFFSLKWNFCTVMIRNLEIQEILINTALVAFSTLTHSIQLHEYVVVTCWFSFCEMTIYQNGSDGTYSVFSNDFQDKSLLIHCIFPQR